MTRHSSFVLHFTWLELLSYIELIELNIKTHSSFRDGEWGGSYSSETSPSQISKIDPYTVCSDLDP